MIAYKKSWNIITQQTIMQEMTEGIQQMPPLLGTHKDNCRKRTQDDLCNGMLSL